MSNEVVRPGIGEERGQRQERRIGLRTGSAEYPVQCVHIRRRAAFPAPGSE